jgi:hypothetical protein
MNLVGYFLAKGSIVLVMTLLERTIEESIAATGAVRALEAIFNLWLPGD